MYALLLTPETGRWAAVEERPLNALGEAERPCKPRRLCIVSSEMGLRVEKEVEDEEEKELMSSSGEMTKGTGLRGRRFSRGEVGETSCDGEGGGRAGEWEL